MAASEHKPVLIGIAGPNGSGKTSVTSKILHHEWLEDSEYINRQCRPRCFRRLEQSGVCSESRQLLQ